MNSTIKHINDSFKDKTLLITGGTGSFGSKMMSYFLDNTNIKEVRIFSRDEEKQDTIRNRIKNDKLKCYIGDIRDYNSIKQATKDVDFVFHAAALKQVPSCEFFPMEAVQTNILGGENVLNAAIVNNVANIVVLSTDKAVYPINVMGMTKAIMEKLMVAKSRAHLNNKNIKFSATRYGNVMASRGSIIPLFVKQAQSNQPFTITNPNMTRFLMSLDESVDLVLYAYNNSNSGDVFVQKAPACTIKDLALAVKEIFASKSEIELIGTRHGEKIHETLINREEMAKVEDLGDFYRIPADVRDINYTKYVDEGETALDQKEEYNSYNTTRLTVKQIVDKLLSLDYIKDQLGKKHV